MTKIKDIVDYLNAYAPVSLQESYDNAGLLVGNPETEVSSIMINLDATEEVVDEAMEKGCNLIIVHHPIIFKGLKRLTGGHYVERVVMKAIKNDLAIFAAHTNLDNVNTGVNMKICERLGLVNTRILAPKQDNLLKLSVFIPNDEALEFTKALNEAGAGQIGEYADCSFKSSGKGSFRPSAAANPTIGTANELEQVDETKVEVIFPNYLQNKILKTMQKHHPYEEVAYFLHQLGNENQEIGSGMIGELEQEMSINDFFKHLKTKMNLQHFRFTKSEKKTIKKVAVCGGSGSFLINKAKAAGADAYITADVKYHEFFEAEGKLIICDVGHYESEIFTNDLFYDILQEKFANIALHLGETVTNPIKYY